MTILTAGHFVTRRVAADSFAFARALARGFAVASQPALRNASVSAAHPRDTADGKSNRPRFVSDSMRKILRMPKASAVKVTKLSI